MKITAIPNFNHDLHNNCVNQRQNLNCLHNQSSDVLELSRKDIKSNQVSFGNLLDNLKADSRLRRCRFFELEGSSEIYEKFKRECRMLALEDNDYGGQFLSREDIKHLAEPYSKNREAVDEILCMAHEYDKNPYSLSDMIDYATHPEVVKLLKKKVEDGTVPFSMDDIPYLVRTFAENPKEAQEIINLKRYDGTPRFCPEEVSACIKPYIQDPERFKKVALMRDGSGEYLREASRIKGFINLISDCPNILVGVTNINAIDDAWLKPGNISILRELYKESPVTSSLVIDCPPKLLERIVKVLKDPAQLKALQKHMCRVKF